MSNARYLKQATPDVTFADTGAVCIDKFKDIVSEFIFDRSDKKHLMVVNGIQSKELYKFHRAALDVINNINSVSHLTGSPTINHIDNGEYEYVRNFSRYSVKTSSNNDVMIGKTMNTPRRYTGSLLGYNDRGGDSIKVLMGNTYELEHVYRHMGQTSKGIFFGDIEDIPNLLISEDCNLVLVDVLEHTKNHCFNRTVIGLDDSPYDRTAQVLYETRDSMTRIRRSLINRISSIHGVDSVKSHTVGRVIDIQAGNIKIPDDEFHIPLHIQTVSALSPLVDNAFEIVSGGYDYGNRDSIDRNVFSITPGVRSTGYYLANYGLSIVSMSSLYLGSDGLDIVRKKLMDVINLSDEIILLRDDVDSL